MYMNVLQRRCPTERSDGNETAMSNNMVLFKGTSAYTLGPTLSLKDYIRKWAGKSVGTYFF